MSVYSDIDYFVSMSIRNTSSEKDRRNIAKRHSYSKVKNKLTNTWKKRRKRQKDKQQYQITT